MLVVAGVVVLSTVMTALDTTIITVAIPRLAHDFDVTLTTIQWVTTGYLLAIAAVTPLTGWAADRFGTRRLQALSIVLFVGGSALSGAAWSAGSLILFRVLQGIGGGMIMPTGITIITRAAGPARVGRVMGIISVPMLLGPVAGPVLGGWLVDEASWRWIFYVNVPVGVLALLLTLRLLPRDVARPEHRLDVLGLALLSPGLALFVYGLSETAAQGGIAAVRAWLPSVAGLALVAAFAVHALRSSHPLIDLRLFRNRVVLASSVTSLMFGATFFGAMLLMPLYYQQLRGASALEAGIMLAPQSLGAMLTMPFAGRLTDRTGARYIVLTGLTLSAIGTVAYTQVTADTSELWLGAALFVRGMGMGATLMPATSAAYKTLPWEAVARATTAINIVQRIGGSIGTAVLAVVLQQQLASHPATPEGVAAAFDHAFWWAVVPALLTFGPALMLPRRVPVQDDDTEPDRPRVGPAEAALEVVKGLE